MLNNIFGRQSVRVNVGLVLIFTLFILLLLAGQGAAHSGCCEIEQPAEQGTTAQGAAPFAVSPTGSDDMGQVLTNMGRSWEQISWTDLENFEKLKAYQAVFINCGSTWNAEEASESLERYVAEGGALYASDFAIDFIMQAFPGYLELAEGHGYVGEVGYVKANVTDSGLAAFLDPQSPPSTVTVYYDLPAWVVIDDVAPGVRVYLRGDAPVLMWDSDTWELIEILEDRPLLVSFEYGLGRVVVTTFHNRPQVLDVMAKMLEYLVLIPETSQTLGQLQSYLQNNYPGLTSLTDYLGMINQGETSSPVSYAASGGTGLVFGANWAGSELKLSVYDPDGQLYGETSGSNPPIVVEVGDARAGEWTFTVTGEDVPHDNYSYVVMAGEVEADVPIPPEVTLPEALNDMMIVGGVGVSIDLLMNQDTNDLAREKINDALGDEGVSLGDIVINFTRSDQLFWLLGRQVPTADEITAILAGLSGFWDAEGNWVDW